MEGRRQGDENRSSNVVAETMKLPANSSYVYQMMDRSRHTITKYLSDERAQAVNNSKLFKMLDHVNYPLYEVELAKVQSEDREPIFVSFFFLQNAKLRILELYYNLLTKFCDVKNFEEFELDIDSLYFAPAMRELEDCIRPELRADWQRLRTNDSVDRFTADALSSFSQEHVV